MGIALSVIAGIALGIYAYHKSLFFEGEGEVLYSDSDGTYQLLLNTSSDRFTPMAEVVTSAESEVDYQILCGLYINHKDSGVNAGQMFRQKMESVSTAFIQSADSPSPMYCAPPAGVDYDNQVAQVSNLMFTGRSGPAELIWTIKMKNGDTILLHQRYIINQVSTFNYYPEDAAMNTREELQTLIHEIEQTYGEEPVVNIYLPAVTYKGGISIDLRPVNLYGSTDGVHRTTFTDTVEVTARSAHTLSIKGIDIIGGGDGVGISASAAIHITNCRIAGWKTGVLGYDDAWVDIADSQIEDNDIGFHFNSRRSSGTQTWYTDNHFTDNGTAVLLENVPSDASLKFGKSAFLRNSKDIDNLCNQALDISEASFK